MFSEENGRLGRRKASEGGPLVWCLVGPPASGKTTWAKRAVANNPMMKRVAKEDLRVMLENNHEGAVDPRENEYLTRVRDAVIIETLKQGYDVIVDETGVDPEEYTRLEKTVREALPNEVQPFFHAEDRFVEEEFVSGRLNNLARERVIPEDKLRAYYEAFDERRKAKRGY